LQRAGQQAGGERIWHRQGKLPDRVGRHEKNSVHRDGPEYDQPERDE